MVNRVHFRCEFHDQPATARLTFEDDGTFICVFLLDGGKVAWPFQGRWTRVNDTVLLTTPHGYAEVVLHLEPDASLTYVSHRGGFIRWNLFGSRTSALPRPLPGVTEIPVNG